MGLSGGPFEANFKSDHCLQLPARATGADSWRGGGTRRLSPAAGGDRRDTQGLAARRPLPTVDSGCRGRRGLVRIALGKSSSASRGDSGGTALAKTRQQLGT